ncbi:FmdB family zinc ribbon protein [Cerasicoccus arenae]|uniref:Putative regulatory protein FmdB zinc ribbon domain-containing protein n=1 Tax=Cerasicoccus arenae TaxID=424488 RepID=A0A8J3GCS6_9BACT|nr:FmdB family zinc ribbon protein [Cerasicoccus arenae]MBK1858189.1 hypothetical protein [Cerasicoccus arenae]GHC00948.1 hypothetical protein GCM10007047_16640 [Cerasicoccus arenae]
MPTYDYHCSACETDFEHVQSMKDAPLTACPLCKKKGKVKRMISSGAGIIFKGTGFYETDYKKKSGGEPKNETPKAETKSEPKTESKKSDSKKSD